MTRRSRKGGPRSSSTPMATAGAMPTPSPISRPIRRRIAASIRRSTRSCRARSTDRSGDRRSVIPARWCGSSPGANPPETALAEVFTVPLPGFAARGADIDSKGVVWVSMGSGHIGSFDRRKCKGAAQRAEGDRRPLSRRLVVLQVSRPRLPGHRRQQRRIQLLQLGRSAQHVRTRQRRARCRRATSTTV